MCRYIVLSGQNEQNTLFPCKNQVIQVSTCGFPWAGLANPLIPGMPGGIGGKFEMAPPPDPTSTSMSDSGGPPPEASGGPPPEAFGGTLM